jgi:hypothetical protein
MGANPISLEELDPLAFRFYRHAIEIMQQAEAPFLVGGAYAFGYYTGIARHTKDLDLFIRKDNIRWVLEVFAAGGYRTELVFTHWLAKAFHANDFIDIIFCSGNGVCPVDASWFERAVVGKVIGADVWLMPVEEMIWQKAYIMERERFDGADVAHLLRACGKRLDWDRLLARFGAHWRVLLGHLILFGFVYPDDRESIPPAILEALTARLHQENAPTASPPLCRGPLLSRVQYLADIEEWGFLDPRLAPLGPMTKEQVVRWTDAGR